MNKSRLEDLYKTKIRPELEKELGVGNVMEVPAISKIVINIAVKEGVTDSKVVTQVKDLIDKIITTQTVGHYTIADPRE